jgi:TRAP-type C4-dicarboxylate transport system substrate-binding protein
MSSILRPSKPSRRRLLLGASTLATSLIAPFPMPAIVHAQQKRRLPKPIVAGLNSKIGDPSYESIARIGAILRDKYNIESDIQVQPSSTLGTDTQQLEAVQIGYIDITSNTTAQFASFSDAFAFVDLPYAIPSWDVFVRIVASDLWKAQAVKFESKLPLKVLPPVGAGGFRLLWNNKRETQVPSAVNGLKFRTTSSPFDIGLVRSWGGNPTPMAWTETYNALSNGVVDGIHVQPIWTYGFNMFEVLKFATAVRAIFAVQFQVLNRATWDSFAPDIQRDFMAAVQEAADQANAMDRASESSFMEKLQGKGMKIYTPSEAQMTLWQKPGQELWETIGKNLDPAVIKALLALH